MVNYAEYDTISAYMLVIFSLFQVRRVFTHFACVAPGAHNKQDPKTNIKLVSPRFRRINIGNRHQAEVPELRVGAAAHQDEHRAELVWAPLHELESAHPARGNGTSHNML